jgi:hypothetical protein
VGRFTVATNVDLKQIERKAWKSYFHQDGFLDIFMGLLLLAMAVYHALSEAGVPDSQGLVVCAALEVVALAIFWAGKRFVTRPRLGLVRFGAQGRARQKKTWVILAISFLAGAALFITSLAFGGAGLPDVLVDNAAVPVLIGIWMMLIFSLVSYFMDFTRGYVIGALYALGFSGAPLLDTPLVFALAGGAVLLMGLIVMIRFLRRYPLPESAASSDTR